MARYSDDRTAATDTHVAIARPDPTRVVPDYLYTYLLGAQGQTQLRSKERGDWRREKVGFRLTELNLADLRAAPVPLPSMEKQYRMVERFHAVRATAAALDAAQGEARSTLDAVMPSVLRQAFAGEL